MVVTTIDKYGISKTIDLDSKAPSEGICDTGQASFFDAVENLYLSFLSQKPLFMQDPNAVVDASDLEHMKHLFLQSGYFALFFTSGTTGKKRGILKTYDNIDSETTTLATMFGGIGHIFLCVPFFHIYGFLFSVGLSLKLGVDITIKESVLPLELMGQKSDTLIVLNPVLLRALLKLKNKFDLSHLNIVSSTGSLTPKERTDLEERFGICPVEIFGSTETGGIAYRRESSERWHLMERITLCSDDKLLIESPHCSEAFVEGDAVMQLAKPHYTGDLIKKLEGDAFALIGREAEIIKIAGKRYAAAEIEAIIESIEGVDEVLVQAQKDTGIRGESVELSITGVYIPNKKEVAEILSQRLNKKFKMDFEIKWVTEIKKTFNGKKMRGVVK